MLSEALRLSTEGGMSIILGTVDADGNPATCRGVALQAGDSELSTVTVYIPVATGQQAIANIATTRRIAVVSSEPISHRAVQFKGVSRSVRLARADEAKLIEDRMAAFSDVLDRLGVPQRVVWSMTHWPAFAVEIAVEEIFDQTPGPKAGGRVR
jgi:hypothetical protein